MQRSNDKFDANSFRALELDAWVWDWNGYRTLTVHKWCNVLTPFAEYLCAEITEGGNYAPIVRAPHPQSQRYKNTLTTTQYNAFIVAATIYAVILYGQQQQR